MVDALIGIEAGASLVMMVCAARELWLDILRATWEEGR